MDATTDVALKGVWLCMKYEIPVMLDSGGGAIVNTSSLAGEMPDPGLVGYNASKAGVNAITKTGAFDTAEQDIRVNAVAPGIIDTPGLGSLSQEYREEIIKGVPKGRLGEPEDIANAVVWLASDEASYITGNIVPVDGGSHIR